MSTATIDYGKLAEQARGGTDYSVLAEQARQYQPEQKGFLQSAADTSGLSALIHPIDTILGLPEAVKQAGTNIADAFHSVEKEGFTSDNSRHSLVRAVPIVGPVAAELGQDALEHNYAGAAGVVAGAAAAALGPKALKGARAALPEAAAATAEGLQKAGDAAQSAGNRIINETAGSYKADFKRGANPGRGYNSTGQGVVWTKGQFAAKAEGALADTGQKLSALYDKFSSGSTMLNVQPGEVIDAIRKPLQDAYNAAKGPGGTGAVGHIESYGEQFKQDVSAAYKRGGYTPRELYDLRKQISKQTTWSALDPKEVELNGIRQAQYGTLSDILNRMVPDVKPLNQAYSDLLALSKRARWRAESGSLSLRSLISEGGKGAAAAAIGALGGGAEGGGAYALMQAADSTAGRTATASALYRGGKAVASAGSKIEDWLRNRP